MPTVQTVIDALEAFAPPSLALPDDRPRIGLHSGVRTVPVARVGLAVDATLGAIEAAGKKGAEMVVTHHPRFYRGCASVSPHDPNGRRAVAMVTANIAVYSAHTNLDIAPGGTNDCLATAVGLDVHGFLVETAVERAVKLAVYVPKTHVEAVRRALDDAGAGAIGNYSGCSFRAAGIGTFRAGPDTSPYLGTPGGFEEAEEFKLETVVEARHRDRVVRAMLAAHPYEEVAYDIYDLKNRVQTYGLGRWGALPSTETLEALAARVAAATGSTMTQYSGKGRRRVRWCAVWAGAGAPVDVLSAGRCDVVITGELGHHEVETLNDSGIDVITVGHGFSEELVLRPLAAELRRVVPGVEFFVIGAGRIAMRNCGPA
ncbi:MAG: Nif3-like dinuclear metal center hexameric protein [Planctomycetaceae bacterium]|nr:Nif3-like dinuclear metal center hexameric protein [Planctomycetaceae bacterium]